ncbi:MAG: PAS domain S-box protein [Anaerolineales bacterium]|nr:PAS domain S-box protein [Anaerolineales bacterium]
MAYEASLMQALYEAAPIAVIVVGQDGLIRHANGAAEKTFGYGRTELEGQSLGILLPERFRSAHQQWLRIYFKHPRQRSMGNDKKLLAQRKDGSEFPAEIGLSSFTLQAETVVAAYIADITARVQAEEKLAQYARELEAQNAELDAFAHTVAHGLKTPLNLIAGYGELLTSHGSRLLAAEKQRMTQVIVTQSLQMNQIVHDLLMLSSVRRTDITMEPLDMAAIVERAQLQLAQLVVQYDAEIVVPDRWETAVGYAPWIAEVWGNYLSNGIKYGGVSPRLVLGSAVQPDDAVRFWVHDNGSGIARSDQSRLFTPFTRLNLAHSEGHGLGLSIVRRIVERCGGQVGVDSQPGKGSTFWFTLPAVPQKKQIQNLMDFRRPIGSWQN